MSRITRGDLDITYHTLRQLARNVIRSKTLTEKYHIGDVHSAIEYANQIVKLKLDKANVRRNKK